LKARSLLISTLAVPLAAGVICATCPRGGTRVLAGQRVTEASNTPTYRTDGSFIVPANYREWIFLSSGIDMVYGPKGVALPTHSRFDNVFVNPEAYGKFVATGTWPDKTVLILEVRGADTNPSINNGGRSQGTDLMGMEIHLKDAERFPDGWAFFDVASPGTGTLSPRPASCYTCHAEHAAVDNTFVQFYPTLLPIAKEKNTLSPAFLKEFGQRQFADQKPETRPSK
jgi:hypothetical protein